MTLNSMDHPDRLEAYLADRLDAEQRASIEEHLADCDVCRARLVELHIARDEHQRAFAPPPEIRHQLEDLGGDNRPAGRQLRLLAATLAAIVLGGGWWIFQSRRPPADDTAPATSGQVFRTTQSVQALELLSPGTDVLLPPGPVDLSWTPVVDAVHYRVMILDPAGVPLAEHRTSERHWQWPGAAGAGFWYVEAELTDGSRLESEPSPLTFAPAISSPGDAQPSLKR